MISASNKGKIHFLMSPKPIATFNPPAGEEADAMVAVVVYMAKDSTYGSFTTVLIAYETYYTDHESYEYHWYTDNRKAGETYAYLCTKVYPTTTEGKLIEWVYDITIAKIDIATSEHQLNATVTAKGKTLFTAKFWADTNAPIESRIEPWSPLPKELYLSVEAYRPTLQALVTGLDVGDFTGGRFQYADTELYDSSLLP